MLQWPARVKVAFLSADTITHMLTAGAFTDPFRCVAGLPDGARLVASTYNERRSALALYFEHESWPLASPHNVERLDIKLEAATPVLA